MKYLLDTNVISELRRPALVNAGVSKWIADVSLDDVRISVITLHELEHGTRKAERNQPDLGLSLRSWMTRVVLPNYLASALPVTAAIAWRAADYPRSSQDQLPDHSSPPPLPSTASLSSLAMSATWPYPVFPCSTPSPKRS